MSQTLTELMYSIIIAVIPILAVICWNLIWKKINKDTLELAFTIFICVLVIMVIFPQIVRTRSYSSYDAILAIRIAAAMATIAGVGYLRFKLTDYIVTGAVLFVIYESTYPLLYDKSIMLISSFALICAAAMRRYGRLKKISAQLILTFICEQLIYYMYEILFIKRISDFYYGYSLTHGFDKLQKVMLLIVVYAIIAALTGLLIYFLSVLLRKYVEKLTDFSLKYQEIGNYLLLIPFFFSAMVAVIEVFGNLLSFRSSWYFTFSLALITMFIITQLFYIKLLHSTINLKEKMKYSEQQKDNILLYNRDIDKNMQEIRAMKHDLKNIFLTMGEYIARSDDNELKAYYYEKIAPYAQNEIKMNDLYVKLQSIGNESMKAFLYYKVMQGASEHIETSIETNVDNSVIPYIADETVITRILGIFIDNAFEETEKLSDKEITIRVTERNNELCFQIKNKVRKSVLKEGINIGATSKGLGRGNGLLIVDKLIKSQKDILWNSYFDDDIFVQSITIVREPERG